MAIEKSIDLSQKQKVTISSALEVETIYVSAAVTFKLITTLDKGLPTEKQHSVQYVSESAQLGFQGENLKDISDADIEKLIKKATAQAIEKYQ